VIFVGEEFWAFIKSAQNEAFDVPFIEKYYISASCVI